MSRRVCVAAARARVSRVGRPVAISRWPRLARACIVHPSRRKWRGAKTLPGETTSRLCSGRWPSRDIAPTGGGRTRRTPHCTFLWSRPCACISRASPYSSPLSETAPAEPSESGLPRQLKEPPFHWIHCARGAPLKSASDCHPPWPPVLHPSMARRRATSISVDGSGRAGHASALPSGLAPAVVCPPAIVEQGRAVAASGPC